MSDNIKPNEIYARDLRPGQVLAIRYITGRGVEETRTHIIEEVYKTRKTMSVYFDDCNTPYLFHPSDVVELTPIEDIV